MRSRSDSQTTTADGRSPHSGSACALCHWIVRGSALRPCSSRPPPTECLRDGGSNLSIEGRWQVVVTVERGVNSVEISLTVALRTPAPVVEAIREPGLPTLYIVKLPAASIQIYLDPERPGPTSVHVTFLDPAGNELPVSALAVTAASPRSGPTALKVIRFGAGHFAAEGTLPTR